MNGNFLNMQSGDLGRKAMSQSWSKDSQGGCGTILELDIVLIFTETFFQLDQVL